MLSTFFYKKGLAADTGEVSVSKSWGKRKILSTKTQKSEISAGTACKGLHQSYKPLKP
jgi:hypothetical protein